MPPLMWREVIVMVGGKSCQSHWMMDAIGMRDARWPFNYPSWAMVAILLYSSSRSDEYNLPTLCSDMAPEHKQDVDMDQ